MMELSEATCNFFYKKFEDILSDTLKDLISDILDGSQLPDTWRYSTTILIPKKSKGKDEIIDYHPNAFYHPNALLNVD